MSFYIYETTVEKEGDVGMTETNAEAIQILKDYKNGVWIETHILEKSLQTVIEQAERAQEVEGYLGEYQKDWSILVPKISRLEEENKRLREALSDIIECSDIETAVQEIARQSLEGVSNDQTIET